MLTIVLGGAIVHACWTRLLVDAVHSNPTFALCVHCYVYVMYVQRMPSSGPLTMCNKSVFAPDKYKVKPPWGILFWLCMFGMTSLRRRSRAPWHPCRAWWSSTYANHATWWKRHALLRLSRGSRSGKPPHFSIATGWEISSWDFPETWKVLIN